MARDDAANLSPGNVLKAKMVCIDFHVVAQLLGKAEYAGQCLESSISLGNHVINKGAGALEHRAAELIGLHELAARYLNAGLNLEQMCAKERDVGQATARLTEGKIRSNKAQQYAVHGKFAKAKISSTVASG